MLLLIAYIVDRLTEYLIEDNNIGLDDALKLIYRSNVYQQLLNVDGELYIQSPSYVKAEPLKGQNECHVNKTWHSFLLINPLYSIFALSNSFFKNEYTYSVLWKYNPVLGLHNFV